MVYFLEADDVANKFNINKVSDHIKKSLSQLSAHYYPLTGRLINKNLIVDCNDEGVPNIETRVSCRLSQVTDNPSPADVSNLLPFKMDEAVDTVLGVQVNFFDCGGIAIGVCISHNIADALSYFQFVKTWAAVTRGNPEPIRTHFQSCILLPPKDVFLAATKEELGSEKKIQLVAWIANLRPRMEPILPEYAFGNYYWPMRTLPILYEKGECHDLFEKVNNGTHIRRKKKWLEQLKFKNVVTLKDTKSSGGIEACVNLTEEDMVKFEHDEEFLAHVSTTG
ncbi:vinorine synthase-like [Prosopis cineraria]|uniref:vinorine synthase-like n=1 Tax=Prosopis cineraria TaxID=364024 RepID=UPI00240F4795|nr:vinorine synthase-like [Prosopis cineraria]